MSNFKNFFKIPAPYRKIFRTPRTLFLALKNQFRNFTILGSVFEKFAPKPVAFLLGDGKSWKPLERSDFPRTMAGTPQRPRSHCRPSVRYMAAAVAVPCAGGFKLVLNAFSDVIQSGTG